MSQAMMTPQVFVIRVL